MLYPFHSSCCQMSRRVRPGLFLGAALGMAISRLPLTAYAQNAGPQVTPPVSNAPSTGGGVLAQIGRELSDILQQNRAGVVMVRGHRLIAPPPQQPGMANLQMNLPNGLPPVLPVIGSGFLVQGNIVVTTAEVAEDIQRPTVIMSDGKRLRVTATSVDMARNLAILLVEGMDGTHDLRLGDSDSVLPGMLAVTIGTQAGFRNSGGLAFIAQTRRAAASGEHRYDNLIQFQGAIGPGSSGSPLFGPTGEVIGIVMAAPDMNAWGGRGTWQGGRGQDKSRFDKSRGEKSTLDGNAKAHRTTRPQDPPGATTAPDPRNPHGGRPQTPFAFGDMMQGGFNPFNGLSSIGFALPVNELRTRLPELVKTAQQVPVPVWTGVQLGMGAKPGVYITNLYVGSPADMAGMETGDIITQVDGHAIHSPSEFLFWSSQGREGQTIKVQVMRGATMRVFDVRLHALPNPEEIRRMSLRHQAEVGVRTVADFFCIA